MFYTHEVDLSDATTVTEMVNLMQIENVDRDYQILEFMATPKNIRNNIKPFNIKDKHIIHIQKGDKIFEVEVLTWLYTQLYTNGSFEVKDNIYTTPAVGQVLLRQNKKKGIKSIRLTQQDLNSSIEYKSIIKEYKELKLKNQRIQIAESLLSLRTQEVIDIEKLQALKLHYNYDKLCEKDNKQGSEYLIARGFTGIENLNVYTSQEDGYGHTKGITTNIDWTKKHISIIGYSSDD